MINMFTKRLFDGINEAVSRAPGAALSQSQLRQLVEATLRKCQLVTREEFDAQQAVLLRTREKVEQLEQQISALEARLSPSATQTPPATSDKADDTEASWEL